jgi:hypothetical protein
MAHLTLQVWDAENQTYVGTIDQAINSEFVDEYNATGFGSVTVPLRSADANLLQKDAVIRVIYQNATRFAWFVETRERTIATDGNQYLLKASGRGLLAWLEDAIVYPQGGLADFLSPDRPFNFASEPGGGWRTSGNYQAAQGVQWRNDTTVRKNLPVRWKDRQAQWIWRTNPSNEVQQGTVNWFYRDFTLTERKRIRFFASCDNSMDVYLDGQLIMSSSDFDAQAPSFTQMARFTITLGVGDHTLAARVRNGKPWERSDLRVTASNDKVSCRDHGLANGTQVTVTDKDDADGLTKGTTYFVRAREENAFKLATTNSDSTIVNVTKDGEIDLTLKSDNTAGFILTGLELDASGKDGAVVIRTNTNWQVSSIEPFWRPAQIVRHLTQEAAERGVFRLNRITFGYNVSSPTNGTWSTEADLTLKVGSDMLTVLEDMVDLGHDFWLNPVTLRLDAWEQRGTNKRTSVFLMTGSNLSRFTSTVERPIKTVAVVRTKNGWLRAANNPRRRSNGWREMFLEYGNMRSQDKARNQALRVLKRTGKRQITASNVEAIVVPGAVPYVNFDVADIISISDPAGNGFTRKARVLSISLKESGGDIVFQPELEVLT